MYKTFCSIIAIFWVFDVMDMPFMQIFDTNYPINGWAWFVIILVLFTVSGLGNSQTSAVSEVEREENELS